MNNQDLTDESTARQREAEFWYRRLDNPDLQDKDWRSFIRWQAIEANQEAFDAIAARREFMFHAHRRTVANSAAAPRHALLKLAAAAIAICVIVAWMKYELQPEPLVFTTSDKAAGWLLEDGSFLRAEPNTSVEVEFDNKRRSTRLRYGNAFFRVAKAVDRPFLVHTELTVIEARGTAFGVCIVDQDAKVTVMEGTVAVSPPDAGDTRAVISFIPFELHENEQARLSPRNIEHVKSADVRLALTWATTIQFHNRPAVEAVTEFSERSGIKIQLQASAPTLASPVSGVFQFDDPVGFAREVANKTTSTVHVYQPGLPTLAVKPQQST